MRIRSILPTVLLLALTLGCASGGGPSRLAGWVHLGDREVTDRADHDRIMVTGARGDFRRIKLTVERASVDFHRVVVHYRGGGDQPVQMRNRVPAGGETRAIDLRGGERVIQSVEFWYDANTIRGRTALVRLYGRR
jgi:hypothetical protein